MQLLKKITAKQLLGDVAKYVKENVEVGESKQLYAVAGIARGIETGVSAYGEWVAFKGKMLATIYHSGEIAQSAKAFIPEPLCSHLREAMGEHEEIEFAFEVGVARKEDDERGVNFEYTVNVLTEVQEADELAHLTKLIPALEAPKVAPKAKAKA
jgi:hypothetical protein